VPPVRQVGNLRVTIRSNRIPQVAAAIAANAKTTVDAAAVSLQTLASQLAPVDTGALRSSIYVNTGDTSDYMTRVGTAQQLNRDMEPLDEIDPEFVIALGTTPGPNARIVVVGVAAHYGLFQEEGTVFQPPQSFMRPAAEATASEFEAAMHHIADNV